MIYDEQETFELHRWGPVVPARPDLHHAKPYRFLEYVQPRMRRHVEPPHRDGGGDTPAAYLP
jgi:hypothetical protein